MKIQYLIIILFGLLVGCSPKMEVPAYIWVDSVDFYITNETEQGTASHKISDVWLTVNGTALGLYQFPARIPVLASGPTRLIFEPGIMDGGVAAKRRKYPFYTVFQVESNLKKGKVDTILPRFTYADYIKFYFIEDFEGSGHLFTQHNGSAPLEETSDQSLIFHFPKEQNTTSGMIELPYTDSIGNLIKHFEIRTFNPIALNVSNISYCLMELNFCITDDIEIGMITHSANPAFVDQQIPLANLMGGKNNPEWKKTYINFTLGIGEASTYQMQSFDIYIKTYSPPDGKARFLFDNIKLVYSDR